MSCSTLYEVHPSHVVEIAEYRNSFHSSMALWQFAAKRYCRFLEGFPLFDSSRQQAVWDCYKRFDVPEPIRIAMAFTLDGIIIPASECELLGLKLLTVGAEVSKTERYPNHWDAIAKDIVAHKPSGKSAIGVALNGTSVSDIWIYGRSKDQITEIGELLAEAKDPAK